MCYTVKYSGENGPSEIEGTYKIRKQMAVSLSLFDN